MHHGEDCVCVCRHLALNPGVEPGDLGHFVVLARPIDVVLAEVDAQFRVRQLPVPRDCDYVELSVPDHQGQQG